MRPRYRISPKTAIFQGTPASLGDFSASHEPADDLMDSTAVSEPYAPLTALQQLPREQSRPYNTFLIDAERARHGPHSRPVAAESQFQMLYVKM